VRYKGFYLPSYRNRVYTVYGICILLGKEDPVVKAKEEICEFNQNFLKKIIKKEKQMNAFMKKFYDIKLNPPLMNDHKICKVRDLDIVNNEEEEKNKEE